MEVLQHEAFITVIALIIIAILVGIVALIYVKRWKKKKELELLGSLKLNFNGTSIYSSFY